jgi:GNAT superfamily N-acetyltransferase
MVSLRKADASHLDHLASMNKELIEDEASRNPMTRSELRSRMAMWLASGKWQIDLVIVDDEVVGYAVWQIRSDEYEPGRQFAHIRQLFVIRHRRSCGIGLATVHALESTRFPTPCDVTIDVLVSNPRANRFWTRAGFGEYATTMTKRT